MRRLFHFLMNNIREHFMLYVILWSLLAGVMDIVYLLFF
ncbi:YceO family protein [Salmonella enterica subsp. enterica]|nr:YceO family protein [Salmonella enterica subsp. enterica]